MAFMFENLQVYQKAVDFAEVRSLPGDAHVHRRQRACERSSLRR